MNLTAAIYARLAGATALTSKLTTFGGQPAIFTDDRVSGDATMPYVVSPGEVANEPWDTKTGRGRAPVRDITVYHEHGSTKAVEEIAEIIYGLFHRHTLTVAGHRTVTASASGPVGMSSDDYDARIVTVRFRLAKEA